MESKRIDFKLWLLVFSLMYGCGLTGYVVGDKHLDVSLSSPAYADGVNQQMFMDTEKLPGVKK